jgi:type IV pilus assembly protein PilW
MPTHSILNRLPHDPRSQRGFTLIELMISLVIGLLLSAAIVKIYVDTSQIYRFQSAVSEVQENGRFASAFLRRATRLAGNFGCDASIKISGSTLSDAEEKRLLFFNTEPPGGALPQPAQPIGGSEGGGVAGVNGENSDELILRGSTGGGVRLTANPANAAADLTVEANSGIDDGNTFGVISNCETTEIFKINDVGNSAASDTIDFDGTLGVIYTTEKGTRVQEVEVVRYCIGRATAWTAANTLMALKRLKNPLAGENCPDVGVGDELVEGIQNLQVLYGVDTDAPADNFANRYVTAPADMSRVKSLRIELLVRSLANNITSGAVPYTLEGTEATPAAGDRHLYKVMTNTITLRNKGT